MNQPNRGTYNKQENFGQMFYHSCFGKIAIFIGVLVLLTIIAAFTVPSEQFMREETTDNIYECIQENDSIRGDQLDDTMGNLLRVFTTADSTAIDKELLKNFHKYNKLEIYRHPLYATAYIHNNLKPEGTRVSIGAFGFVLPTVTFNDILLYVGPMHRDYGDGIIRSTIHYGSDYTGENPDIKPYKGPAE